MAVVRCVLWRLNLTSPTFAEFEFEVISIDKQSLMQICLSASYSSSSCNNYTGPTPELPVFLPSMHAVLCLFGSVLDRRMYILGVIIIVVAVVIAVVSLVIVDVVSIVVVVVVVLLLLLFSMPC